MTILKKIYLWHLQYRCTKHLKYTWTEAYKDRDFATLKQINKILSGRLGR